MIHCVVIKSTQTPIKCKKIVRFDSCSVPLARLHTRARFSPRSPAAARCSGSGWAATRSPDCQALSQRRSSSYPVALLHTHLISSGCRPFLVKGCKTSSEFKKMLISKEGCSRIALPLGFALMQPRCYRLPLSGQDARMEISSKSLPDHKTASLQEPRSASLTFTFKTSKHAAQ